MKRRVTKGAGANKAPTRKAPKRRSAGAGASLQKELDLRTRERDEARNQLSESLEQQTATSEVLKVISSSPGELEPVFQAMLANATRICQAKFGILFLLESEGYRTAAMHNAPPALVEARRREPLFRPPPETALDRMARQNRAVQIADMFAEPGYFDPKPGYSRPQIGLLADARTVVAVPMHKDDKLVGAIVIYRQEVRPFTDKQIELVQNFAAQAVIAIENTRLLNELRQRTDDLTESLEQQTATSEVLQIISASAAELQPVFQATINNATRLCGANFGALALREGDVFRNMANIAMHGVRPAYFEERLRDPMIRPTPGHNLERLLHTKAVVHIPDLASDVKAAQALFERAGARALLNVPLLKDNDIIGSIMIYREEPGAFTDKQIALVQNFAAQAVIAIENTRLLNELRQRTDDLTESLEQQTATSEVLKVVSSSPGDLQPVFQAMLENATRICEAEFGILFGYDGKLFTKAAARNAPPALLDFLDQRGAFLPPPGTALHDLLTTRDVAHRADASTSPESSAPVRLAGAKSFLAVPMFKDDALVGAISIYRQEVRPFTDKQIALVQNFAAQAVIAIENTRLLNELRQRTDDLTEALEQQTATSEVLKVISSSPGDLEPVFQAMLENATRICEANFGTLFRYDGTSFRRVAGIGVPGKLVAYQQQTGFFTPTNGNDPLSRMSREKVAVHVADELLGSAPSPPAKYGGARSLVAVPMLKDEQLVGAFVIYRQEVRPFTDKQIALVQNFAAQAVIAIENTRLLSELRQRTDDLTESLEQQTATSEVLQVISSSPGELQAVFQTMLENATRICQAQFGILNLYDGEAFHNVALHNPPPQFAGPHQNAAIRPHPDMALGIVARTKGIAHIDDIRTRKPYLEGHEAAVRLADDAGARTLLIVPMLKEGELIGTIGIYRQEVRPFTDKQIELLSNFAAQAVIAIENTRLLNELRQRTDDLTESLEQQTATSRVLGVIAKTPSDLVPVFEEILANVVRLCEGKFANVILREGEVYRMGAMYGAHPDYAEHRRRDPWIRPSPETALGQMTKTKRAVQFADSRDTEAYRQRDAVAVVMVEVAGARTVLCVPMLKDHELIGAIIIYRTEVRPFTDKQIELVQNFAAQAVIAIENTRLLNELRESLQQQTATADVLKVISRSAFDLQTVLDTLIESAARLCHADKTAIRTLKDGYFHNVASYGYSAEQIQWLKSHPYSPDRSSVVGQVMLDGKLIHVPDVQNGSEYEFGGRAGTLGVKTMLGVPLLREGAPIGALILMRSAVRPFTDKQIALVTTFADQAVIAIENVRLFDEIQDKSRQLAEASQHKSQFLANMSHELRTPLNAILGYTELIADGIYGAPPEKMQAVLKRVESNGKHLLGLINAVLDLSKIEAGQLVLDLADYSLGDVAHSVYSAIEPLAADKKLTFKTEVARDLPLGRGDERRLTQVVLNLVGNAIKFTDSGEVVIKAGADNGAFTLSVRDTGPGISAADQAKLFQEFQQADNSITRKKVGTGLGLAISKRIIEMHDGRIWVESQVGQGSTFSFTLPVRVEQQVKVE